MPLICILCRGKLDILLEQEKDLTAAIDMLLADIEAGRKIHEGVPADEDVQRPGHPLCFMPKNKRNFPAMCW